MNLEQCPYDGTSVNVEVLPDRSILLACPTCEAAWEFHGAWIGQLRKPDRNKVRAARRRAASARIDTAATTGR